ncbi:MAG: fructose-6-phosphate aldolase [Gemmatimonadetes bacterium]|jgi:transaldolase|nr:fructose-6-phosphate aldolase [Gemmatimonadota bacterium]MCH2452363.1 fructose-6-phosphate aldolase [Gemmatimonadota bacterium]MEE2879784.1 fructose-6-phosphate aldolase [Gemmatimonadota bacterium]|tara:strand:+ start:1036 stop:1692 length:657 start_codon:yes stop_codon:yes gene_type:complete
MRIFLDTADPTEIRRAAEAGLIDGVTTNPSLLAKVAKDREPSDIFREICETVEGPVSAEVVALDAEGMIQQGKTLFEIADNIVIKVPLTEEGLVACRALTRSSIPVNVTLCFSPTQAHLAAKAGATYISPFIGRIDDISGDGMDLISQIRQIYDNYDIGTEILAASIRNPLHMVQSLMVGADCATIPPKVLYQLLKHPLTDKGLEGFMNDWKTLGRDL